MAWLANGANGDLGIFIFRCNYRCLPIFLGHDRRSPFAFGPYLCLAGWVAMEWGDQLSHLFSLLRLNLKLGIE